MCSIVILSRPGNRWPVAIGANRDEMVARPWRAPGRHWPDRAEVVGGLDELAGGSWLGLSDHGVVAAVLNRQGTLGPAAGKRSRGELVLEALDHADAAEAAGALADLDPAAYRPFNMLVADNRDVLWLCNRGGEGAEPIRVLRVPPGVSMLTALDLNDSRDPRVRDYLPRFAAAAPAMDPGRGAWGEWPRLLASRLHEAAAGPPGAMCFLTEGGFGTSSSSLIALPSPDAGVPPVWRFAAGPPDTAPYLPV